MTKPLPAQARTMSPKKAAAFLREHFTKEEQLAELKAMLSLGGRITNLAHGIAVELRLIEHEELEEPLVTSLKLKAVDVGAAYGASSGRDASERSPFAGQGPMYARMGSAEIKPEGTVSPKVGDAPEPDETASDDDNAG